VVRWGAARKRTCSGTSPRSLPGGRLGKPVEFGRKAQVVEGSDGVVVDYEVFQGNPPDAPQLPRAIARIKARFGRAPRAATADHGYGEAKTEAELAEAGVKKVAIPRKGKPSTARRKAESSRGFRDFVKWRTGSEGRTAVLKHRYGWARSLMDGTLGAATWCGWGVFAHNSVKLAHLAATKGTTAPAPRRRQAPPGNAPPGAAPPPTPPLAA
jgi:IS5 family transposase